MNIAMSVFSLLGTFVIGFSMLPQTIATFKTRETANISLGLYFLMGVATLLITFYGIGLCCVPTNIASIATDAYNAAGGASNALGWKEPTMPIEKDVISGYIVPGAAVIFGEIFCSVTSFMIAAVKIENQMRAKKLGISEAEYIAQYNANKKQSVQVEGEY